ncbi:hypothetical protein CR513_06095, partial [Mucuna pruriens]
MKDKNNLEPYSNFMVVMCKNSSLVQVCKSKGKTNYKGEIMLKSKKQLDREIEMLVSIPYEHALTTIISYRGESLDKYVHQYYKKELYELCYGHEVSLINGQNMWPKYDFDEILPLIYKIGPKRPKILRREPDESSNSTKLRRVTTLYACTRCGNGERPKTTK